MKTKFRIGVKVKLKKDVTSDMLWLYGCNAQQGVIYTVIDLSSDHCKLSGSNWCMSKHLVLLSIKNRVGGEII